MPAPPKGPREFEPDWLQRSLDRYLTWGLLFMVVLIFAFPLYRIREPSLRADAKTTQQAEYTKTGAVAFSNNCASCHGDNGTGGSAPTLNSKEFLGSTEDNQIQLLISGGVSGSSMSAWSQDFGGSLTSEQIREIVTYLRSLEANAPSVPDWRTGAKAGG
jgi:mono/diheme cytochrome c family protein